MGHTDISSSETILPTSSTVQEAARRQYRLQGGRKDRWNVRASAADAAVIEEKADRAGVTVPRLLVSLAVGSSVRSSVERKGTVSLLVGLKRQLAGVGTNLNQLAHHANAMGELPEVERLDEALGSVEVLRAQLESVLAEVERS